MASTDYDAIVVGAGPNGLTAAALLARHGLRVLVVEAAATPGGGARTAALTLPGYAHDACSAVHPLGALSPAFRMLGVHVGWIDPPAPLAQLVGDDDRAVLLERDLGATVAQFTAPDARAYRALFAPFLDRADALLGDALAPLHLPRLDRALPLARFGLRALRSIDGLTARFAAGEPRALLAGIAAHANTRPGALGSAAVAMVLALAGHVRGWPLARGGSQAITDALVAALTAAGGTLACDRPIRALAELPAARAYVFDTSPAQLAAICGDRLPARYRRRLAKFRRAGGVTKIDWALAGPIPWRDPAAARAATVHVPMADGDTMLVVQPTLFDPERAPAGHHVGWAYVHRPAATAAELEARLERAAPGFRDRILARAVRDAAALARYNASFEGGDIVGGANDLAQLVFRPVARRDPYATPARDIFLCSASTPPGAGVHGLCGYFAARSVLARLAR